MIIAGNSNIACLDHVGTSLHVGGAPVEVHWVGALRFKHFFDGHPAGDKVRRCFAAATGYRLLAIGTHDVFDVCHGMASSNVQALLQQLMDHAEAVFAELAAMGPCAWMVFPQPRYAIRFAHLGPDDVHAVAVKVYRALADVVRRQEMEVLDPFAQLDGEVVADDLLQRDRQHLSSRGAARYAQAIADLAGVAAELVHGTSDFEPRDELESFCGMLLREIGVRPGNVPAEGRLISSSELEAELVSVVRERLADKGLDLEVTPDTELVDAGLLDSLDLVEIYAYASHAIGMEVPFDVDLRELGSVQRVVRFLTKKCPPSNGPTMADFAVSTAASRGEAVSAAEADAAHTRIAAMGGALCAAMRQQLKVTLHGTDCPYGVVLFWLALFSAETGDTEAAQQLLCSAASVHLPFPISGALAHHWQARWATLEPGVVASPNGQTATEESTALADKQAPCWERQLDPTQVLAVVTHAAAAARPPDTPTVASGEALFEAGDVDGARAVFEHVVRQRSDADAFNNLGVLLAQQGDITGGVQHLRAALQVDPLHVSALANLRALEAALAAGCGA